ncbi:unnamed protein product [Cuscuta epithymum]|uniref:Uncharacterized protein n=1 Tax=Cuscuta epithymum TaxID=186058 RepID=A0AAV0GE95_9ASTE|nr:unnamed protein product [Cuscuta epithymum]
MAGVAIVLDLLRKKPSSSGQTLHSYGVLSAQVAASAAAASIAATTPFASRAFFGNSVAFCDAGTGLTGDYISSLGSDFAPINLNRHSSKVYFVEQKPLLSAFYWKSFVLTSLRAFLLNYMALLESCVKMKKMKDDEDDEDDDYLQDSLEEKPVDLITPFKRSVRHICRETTVVTTRRVLERVAVHYVSQRMAWKLLKDVPKSAARKAGRKMPTLVYTYSVSRSTFRGYVLGALASWIVQIGIDIYGLFNSQADREEKVRLFGKKVYTTTIRCGTSLVFASIGAGLGAAFIHPTVGQWIGCAVGDVAGPYIVAMSFQL